MNDLLNEDPQSIMARVIYFLDKIKTIGYDNLTDDEKTELTSMAVGMKDAANQLYWSIMTVIGNR